MRAEINKKVKRRMFLRGMISARASVCLAFTTIVLSGCGAGDFVSGTPDDVSAVQLIHEPVVDTGDRTVRSVLKDQGVVFFTGNRDGTISQIRALLNEDESVLTLFVDGDSTQQRFETRTLGNESSEYGKWTDGDRIIWLRIADDQPNWIKQLGPTGVFDGYGGLIAEALPTDTASYGGSIFLYSNGNFSANADSSVVVDFTQNAFSGTLTGIYYDDTGVVRTGTFSGAVAGTLDNSIARGTATLSGGATGTLNMLGSFYSNEDFAGAIAGEMIVPHGAVDAGGNFSFSKGATPDPSLHEPQESAPEA